MKLVKHTLLLVSILTGLYACNSSATLREKTKKQPDNFIAFVKNFDTIPLPLILSYPGFLKNSIFIDHNLKKIEPDYIHDILKMDSLPPWPLFYYGQLPMLDSTYYLITYYEMKIKHNPSLWWTLIKFDYYGKLLSETNISYCVKDENDIRERFCKVMPNYQCFYVETQGRWDSLKHTIIDTLMTNRTINLTYDQNR